MVAVAGPVVGSSLSDTRVTLAVTADPVVPVGSVEGYAPLLPRAFEERADFDFAVGCLAFVAAFLVEPLRDDRSPGPVSRPRWIICAKSSIRVGVTGCDV